MKFTSWSSDGQNLKKLKSSKASRLTPVPSRAESASRDITIESYLRYQTDNILWYMGLRLIKLRTLVAGKLNVHSMVTGLVKMSNILQISQYKRMVDIHSLSLVQWAYSAWDQGELDSVCNYVETKFHQILSSIYWIIDA